jgi:tripartite-type tricarboxylate transporter receptor subunit TctC
MSEAVCQVRRGVLAAGLGLATPLAMADLPYPQRAIRLVCPTTPGSSPDTLARLVGHQLSLQLGQPVVVENLPGAGTTRGSAAVAGAVADGYTLLVTFSPTFSLSALRYKSSTYEPQRSFTPVGSFARITPFMVVNAAVAAQTIQDYVVLAKRSPQRLEFAHSGAAGVPLLLGEAFAQAAGIELLFVPYGSEAESRNDVISGRVSTAVFWAPVTLQLARAGKIRVLGYAGASRHPDLPEVPTFAEQGFPTVNFHLEMLLLGPAGLAADITQRLSRALSASMRTVELQAQLQAIGVEPTYGSPEQAAALIAQDTARFRPAPNRPGFKPE